MHWLGGKDIRRANLRELLGKGEGEGEGGGEVGGEDCLGGTRTSASQHTWLKLFSHLQMAKQVVCHCAGIFGRQRSMIPPKTNFSVAWRSTFVLIRMHFPCQENTVCMYISMCTFLIAMATW